MGGVLPLRVPLRPGSATPALAAAGLAGALLAVQTRVNGQLGLELGGALPAAHAQGEAGLIRPCT